MQSMKSLGNLIDNLIGMKLMIDSKVTIVNI